MAHEGQWLGENAIRGSAIRGSDSGSLLRLYDRARDFVAKSASQAECLKADKVIQRIVKELVKRKVRF